MRRAKLERNCRLLELERRDAPEGKADGIVLCALGRALQGLGRWEDAGQVLRECVAGIPPPSLYLREAHWRLASGWQRLGRGAEALGACRAGRAACVDDPELCFLEARLSEEAGDVAGAERALRELLVRGRSWSFAPGGVTAADARRALAILYRRQGRTADAEAQWRRLARDAPSSAAGWAGLGDSLVSQKRWEEAVKALREACVHWRGGGADDGGGRQMFQQLARANLALGRRAEALAACRDGRAAFPDDAALCFLQGQSCQEMGDPAGAVQAWCELLEPGRSWRGTDPGLTGFKTRYALGQVYAKQGKAAEAEKAWKQVMHEAPSNLAAPAALGQLYVDQKRWDDAEELARALERRPDGRVYGARLRGQIAMARGS